MSGTLRNATTMWVDTPDDYVPRIVMALVWGRREATFWSFSRQAQLRELEDADWKRGFTLHQPGVVITAEVEQSGFYYYKGMAGSRNSRKTTSPSPTPWPWITADNSKNGAARRLSAARVSLGRTGRCSPPSEPPPACRSQNGGGAVSGLDVAQHGLRQVTGRWSAAGRPAASGSGPAVSGSISLWRRCSGAEGYFSS